LARACSWVADGLVRAGNRVNNQAARLGLAHLWDDGVDIRPEMSEIDSRFRLR